MMISSYLFIIKMPLFLFWGNKYQKHNTQKEDKYFYRLPYKLLSKSLVSAHSFRKQCILKLSFIHVRFMDQSTPTHQGPLMLDVVALANRAGPQKWRHVDVISAGPALLDFYVFLKALLSSSQRSVGDFYAQCTCQPCSVPLQEYHLTFNVKLSTWKKFHELTGYSAHLFEFIHLW